VAKGLPPLPDIDPPDRTPPDRTPPRLPVPRGGASLARRGLTMTEAEYAQAPLNLRQRFVAGAHRLGALGTTALRLARDIALPAQCAHCRAPVQDNGLCPSCWSQLALIEKPYCPRLGIPFVYDPGAGVLSMEAIADPPAYFRARAAARYDEIAGALIHALKYHDRTDLAGPLAQLMQHAGRELLAEADALLPVPLHWRRAISRRYNQSGLLARQIGFGTSRPVLFDALRRIRPTAQQVGLSRAARARNVQGAFGVPAAARAQIEGRRLVLIDDVLTSGATADACARALLRAGARQVDLIVFARVVEGARAPI